MSEQLRPHTPATPESQEEKRRILQRREDTYARAGELESQVNDLKKQAETDSLMEIPNRRGFEAGLAELRARLGTQQNSPDGHPQKGVFIMMDIDHFKKVNDTYGHQAGDHVLKEVAKVLKERTREGDCIGRIGGEELAFAFTTFDMSFAEARAEKLRIEIQQAPIVWEGQTIPVTISLGVTEIQPTDTLLELKERADKALYKAKESGRDQVQISEAA